MNRDEEEVDDEEMPETPSKSNKAGSKATSTSRVSATPSATPVRSAKQAVKSEYGSKQTAHIFKAEKPDHNVVINIDDDERYNFPKPVEN
ncbi:hypothetical protein H072_5051 [Dactylellina haptotyla CBS 200.50]|uniref:Uncharacterized protein n=1 Tax=Dactylellina haptotyla (strain CBS 200.50) TaxID=1284197 RepID=S8AIS7_DACHA|nr:hypothetical protein H072_5051 [Dactylellina haptotyla CBS 200.50]